MIAQRLTVLTGHTVSPKQVRGRVRGDSGAPLLSRFGEGKAPYASHVYDANEANKIGTAMIASSNARSGKSVKWSLTGATRKPRTVVKATPAQETLASADE
jgi:hypothetical protein